jgi:drug/metabolite transporter (DMT)-like permease
MAPQTRPPLFGFAVVLLGASLFGTLGPLSYFVYQAGMEPIPFVAWRALLGALTVGAFVAWRIGRGTERLIHPRDLRRSEARSLAIAAACGAGLNMSMFIAFDRIAIALALLCFYTYPAMIATLDIASGRERLDGPKRVALALALGGMVAVVASQLDPAAGVELDAIGVALALAAAVFQTVFVTVSRDGYRRVPADQATAVIIGAAFGACIALALVTGTGAAMTFPLTNPSVWPLLLFTGVFAAALPSLCFLIGIRVIGGMRAGIVMLFEPVVGVALAALLLNESLQPIQLLGGAAILAAALILQRTTPGRESEVDARTGSPEGPVEEDALALHVPGGP